MTGSGGGPETNVHRKQNIAIILTCAIALILVATLLSGLNTSILSIGNGSMELDAEIGADVGDQGGGAADTSTVARRSPSADSSTTADQESRGGDETPVEPPSSSADPSNETDPGELPRNSPSGVGSTLPQQTSIGGRLEAMATIPVFVYSGPDNRYFRQGAYKHYSGTAWSDPGKWRQFNGSVPQTPRTGNSREVSYQIRPLVEFSSLPLVWRPDTLNVRSTTGDLHVSSTGAIKASRALSANSTYRAQSSPPRRGSDRLRASDGDYPPQLHEEYTQLPDATPQRVSEFTEQLTAEADTSYDTAVRIRDWLKENKSYSLNASHQHGEPIADQFLFEMEKGYCQYFATSMVVMLRSQDIPARYAVGYMGGKSIGDNRSLVTSDTSHAWVEVYFPNTGWVRFEPTAAGELPIINPQPPYDISLNRTAVAGAATTITVEKNGSQVMGAPVFVNKERVGWTDSNGSVVTQFPVAVNFTVTVRPPGTVGDFTSEPGSSQSAASSQSVRSNSGATDEPMEGETGTWNTESPPDRKLSLSPRTYSTQPEQAAVQPENQSTATYQSSTNVSIHLPNQPVQGTTPVLTARIEDVPFRQATVLWDGTEVGVTNRTGQYALDLSGIEPGNHTVTVRRGEFVASTKVIVSEQAATPRGSTTPIPSTTEPSSPLNLTLTSPVGIPFPGAPATVSASHAGEPVPNATVVLGGEEVGSTGPDGTLELVLPMTGSTQIDVSKPETGTDRIVLSRLYYNVALVVGIVGSLVGAVIYGLHRRGMTVRSIPQRIPAVVAITLATATTWLIQIAAVLTELGARSRDNAIQVGKWLRELPGRLLSIGRASVRHRSLRYLARLLADYLWGKLRTQSDDSAGLGRRFLGGRASGQAREAGTGPAETALTLRDLWKEFIAVVKPPKAATSTPGEIARYAISRGLPERPTHALVKVYRDSEYGQQTPDASVLERARSALQEIQTAADDGINREDTND